MYWDLEGLVCVLGHRGFGMRVCVCIGTYGHRGFGVRVCVCIGTYGHRGSVCILGGIWDSLSYSHANDYQN